MTDQTPASWLFRFGKYVREKLPQRRTDTDSEKEPSPDKSERRTANATVAIEKPPMLVEVRCRSEHDFDRTTTRISAGPYSLALLPKVSGGTTEGILIFEDARIHKHGFSKPDEQAQIILDILSVVSGTTWTLTGLRVSGVDRLGTRKRVLDLEGEHPPGDIDLTGEVTDALRLDKETLQQFIRSSHAFNLGIQAGIIDLALSYLLLVTSVECLSSLESYIPNSELNRQKKSAERYVRFIHDFCLTPQIFYGEKGEEGFTEDLKTVYYLHRSPFVHGGKEVPPAATATADALGIPSITHYVDSKKVSTPGLIWFSRVVRRSLVGFLKQFPKNVEVDREPVQEIAARRGIISLPMAEP
jgi:hypothetical protein